MNMAGGRVSVGQFRYASRTADFASHLRAFANSKFHLKTSNQPTGASDGAAKREQRCRQLTGLTEPPKSSICMVTINRPTR